MISTAYSSSFLKLLFHMKMIFGISIHSVFQFLQFADLVTFNSQFIFYFLSESHAVSCV